MTLYFIVKNGEKAGPFDEATVRHQIEAGQLTPADLCWREGMPDWKPIGTILTTAANKVAPRSGGSGRED